MYIVGTSMGGGPQRNQRKFTFRNHSRPLDSIGHPKCVFRVTQDAANKFLRNFKKIFYFSKCSTALLTHSLTYVCVQSNIAKTGTVQPHFFGGNALNFVAKNLSKS